MHKYKTLVKHILLWFESQAHVLNTLFPAPCWGILEASGGDASMEEQVTEDLFGKVIPGFQSLTLSVSWLH